MNMTPKETKRFINTLRSPDIRPFINTSKLLMSKQFDNAAAFAIAHRLSSNDSTFIHGILDTFSASPSYRALLHWFCDRASLTYSANGGKVRLHLSAVPPKNASLTEYISTHKGSLLEMTTKIAPTTKEPTPAQKLAKMFGPDDGRKGGHPFLQGGAPGLGKK
jgi:hypothetical protein